MAISVTENLEQYCIKPLGNLVENGTMEFNYQCRKVELWCLDKGLPAEAARVARLVTAGAPIALGLFFFPLSSLTVYLGAAALGSARPQLPQSRTWKVLIPMVDSGIGSAMGAKSASYLFSSVMTLSPTSALLATGLGAGALWFWSRASEGADRAW